jgi:hypothetical protein
VTSLTRTGLTRTSHYNPARALSLRGFRPTTVRESALIGSNGLTRHNPLEQHLRDVLCARVHTPQDDSVVAAAARAAFPGF